MSNSNYLVELEECVRAYFQIGSDIMLTTKNLGNFTYEDRDKFPPEVRHALLMLGIHPKVFTKPTKVKLWVNGKSQLRVKIIDKNKATGLTIMLAYEINCNSSLARKDSRVEFLENKMREAEDTHLDEIFSKYWEWRELFTSNKL